MNGSPVSLYLMQFLTLLLVGGLQFAMPRLTRADLWFAVTVAPGFRDTAEAREIERAFRRLVIVHTLIALILVVVGAVLHLTWLFPVGLVWQLTGSTAAFIASRQRALPYAVKPSTVREASLVSPESPRRPLLQVGPFLVLGGVALWLASRWESLPARIPLHMNVNNQVDRWGARTVANVFGPLLVGAGVCVFLWLIGGAVDRTRRVRVSGGFAAAEHTFRRATKGIVLASEYLVATTTSAIAVVIGGGPTWLVTTTPLVTIVFIVAVTVVLVRTGQGGSRLAGVPTTAVGDRTNDAAWKWGVFYFAPDDPALWVEKRFGIGYTLNFGHKAAWLMMAAILLAPLIIRGIAAIVAH